MGIICFEKDIQLSQANKHRGGALICDLQGATNGFSMGISYYDSDEYGNPGVHNDQEGFYVLEGVGKANVGDEEFDIFPGVSFIAKAGIPHSIKKTAGTNYVKILWCHGAI